MINISRKAIGKLISSSEISWLKYLILNMDFLEDWIVREKCYTIVYENLTDYRREYVRETAIKLIMEDPDDDFSHHFKNIRKRDKDIYPYFSHYFSHRFFEKALQETIQNLNLWEIYFLIDHLIAYVKGQLSRQETLLLDLVRHPLYLTKEPRGKAMYNYIKNSIGKIDRDLETFKDLTEEIRIRHQYWTLIKEEFGECRSYEKEIINMINEYL